MRLTLVALVAALALVSACGSDPGGGVDLGGPDLGVGDLAAADLGDCPSTYASNGPPTKGGTCSSFGERCPYFEAYCSCDRQEQHWICCWVGVLIDCPAVAPTPGDLCCEQYVTPSCAYACNGGVATSCHCVDDHWQCASAACD